MPRSFYERDTLTVAHELLGKILVRRVDGQLVSGCIVETEAYRGAEDPASHAYRGLTRRNAVMFGPAGVAYVYLSYGLNWCFNATTEEVGKGAAVLIRAVQPTQGLDLMRRNRNRLTGKAETLSNGPGKLCQAMSITGRLNGVDLTSHGELSICESEELNSFEVEATTRIGIKKASGRRWRYVVKGNPFVSR